MSEIYLSVVIPTWMRRNSLLRLVDSLIAQSFSYKLFEIIIIDSNSSDGTEEKLYEKIVHIKGLNIKILHCELNKPSSKRNLGIKSAQGQWIIFIDDDCLVGTDFLDTYFNRIKHLKYPATILCGEVRYPDEWISNSNYYRYRDSRHFKLIKIDRPLDFRTITTMNMALNSSCININKLYFDEDFIFSLEDSDFGYMLFINGFHFEYCAAGVLHYESCGSISKYGEKIEKISSQGFSLIFKKYPEAAKLMSWYALEPKPGILGQLVFNFKKLLLSKFTKKLLIKFLEKTDRKRFLYSGFLFKCAIACYYVAGVKNNKL